MVTNVTILNTYIISKYRQSLNSAIVRPALYDKAILRIFTLII